MSLAEIATRIDHALEVTGRKRGDLKLIAVSKKQPLDRVESVLDTGHRVFGENRVQEAAAKWPDFRERYGDVELHIIGPLQTNKVRQAMSLTAPNGGAIHTLDREKLVRTIARIADEEGNCPDLFVQVNTGEEPQKAGVLPSETDALVALCRTLSLPVVGLMCIPPADEPPSLHFALLAKMAERNGLPGLSMGMSGDFEEAITFGANHIRVGSAIFGARPTEQ